ncbi:MAG: PAS domain-containing sensor histidine kinase [Thermodesulfobacteriota bacterium]
MQTGVGILKRLNEMVLPVLQRQTTLSRQGRALLTAVLPVLGARAGALCAWERGGVLAVVTSRGLSPEASGRLRRTAQAPPACPGEPLGRLGWLLLKPGQAIDSGWPDLDRLAAGLAQERPLAVWPLSWPEGSGLALLCLEETPRWPSGFAQAAAGCLGLALGNILLLRRAESRSEDYRRIFQNSQDMVYLSSRDGRWLNVNQAGVRMLGYESEEELLGVPDSAQAAYLNPEDRKAFMAAIEKDGFVKDYEVTFKRKDGSPVEVSITSQVRRENGQVVGYEGIIKDITPRKMALAQAERERWLIAAILEAMPVAVFVVDNQHRVIHWNRACEELTGVAKDAILGTTNTWQVFRRPPGVSLADLVVDDDAERLNAVYGPERLRRSPIADAWEAEAHFPDLGGRPKDLFFTAAALRDPQGGIVGAVEAILDFTNLKALEGQLAESEALYRTLVEANREGIALNDGERFIFANRHFLEMFGLPNLLAAKGDLLELMAPGSQRAYLEWGRALSVGSNVSTVFEGQGRRGEAVFDLELTTAPASFQGKIATLFNVRDVTYRKRMEEQLIRSERLAATGKLAFDIAHEVNNPLGGILTYAHLMAEDLGEDNPLFSTAEKIIKLTNRCKIIVRGLLDFARQDMPNKEALDLNQVLGEMLSLIEGHVILKGVELTRRLDPHLPSFYGHRAKLEQVFLNMVINAAEAMEGKGRLELTTSHDEEAGEIRVVFRDYGPGIPEDVARRIFEPFFTTKARGRGTGLGLAISHGIIKQHEGRIELVTAPGKGATFSIVLPAARTGKGEAEARISQGG